MDSALTALAQQMEDLGVADVDGSLRASTHALLNVAYAQDDYDVWLVPAHGDVALRVQHTLFGLEADVVARATAKLTTATDASDARKTENSNGGPPEPGASDDHLPSLG